MDERKTEDQIVLSDMYYTLEYDESDYLRFLKLQDKAKREQLAQEAETAAAPFLSSSFGMKYLLNEVSRCFDANARKQVAAFLVEIKPNKSKWASPDKVGQEILYEACEKVLADLKAFVPFSVPFLTKVNKREVPDYYDVIKNPMDLGTVGKKLKAFAYNTKREFLDDLHLIWSNCFQYNVIEGNIYAAYAHQMKARTELLAEKIPEVTVLSKDAVFSLDFEKMDEDKISQQENRDVEEFAAAEETAAAAPPVPPSSEEEKIEDPILDEQRQVNIFRETFFQERMEHISCRKSGTVAPRSSKNMGVYYTRMLCNDNALIPEFQFFSDTVPLTPSCPPIDRESKLSLSHIDSVLPSSNALDQVLKSTNILEEIRSCRLNVENLMSGNLTNFDKPSRSWESCAIFLNKIREAENAPLNSRATTFAMNPIISLILTNLGFECAHNSSLFLLIQLFSNYFHQLGRTLRFFLDNFRDHSMEKAVESSLLVYSGTSLNDLYDYTKGEHSIHSAKLEHIHKKVSAKMSELLQNNEDSPEELSEEDFVTGKFGEALDIDIFGFKELGLDIEKIPPELFYAKDQKGGRSIASSSQGAGKAASTAPSFRFPVVRSAEGQIGLLREYFTRKIEADGCISEEEVVFKPERRAFKKASDFLTD